MPAQGLQGLVDFRDGGVESIFTSRRRVEGCERPQRRRVQFPRPRHGECHFLSTWAGKGSGTKPAAKKTSRKGRQEGPQAGRPSAEGPHRVEGVRRSVRGPETARRASWRSEPIGRRCPMPTATRCSGSTSRARRRSRRSLTPPTPSAILGCRRSGRPPRRVMRYSSGR